VGEKAEVADADKSPWQYVQQESPQELIHGQGHEPLFILMSRIAPPEGDEAVGERNESVIGNRNAMSITTEIAERMLRTAEWPFAIHHPIGAKQGAEHGRESLRRLKRCQFAVKAEFVVGMQTTQARHKLAAKHTAEHFHRKKEVVGRGNPSGVIDRQTAGRNHAMDMGMMQQLLIPGMQDAEESNLGAEMFGITGDLKKSFGAGAKQEGVDFALVL
jgi:hypothetical protein